MEKQAVARTRYVRISPRKARIIADVIRGMMVENAISELTYGTTKASKLLLKTLKSALANAESQEDVQRDALYVSEIRVDEGPSYKRAWARSKGKRSPILRKTSHFTIALNNKTQNREKKK